MISRPSVAIRFYKSGENGDRDSGPEEVTTTPIYAQLTGLHVRGVDTDCISYMEHKWQESRLMSQFFAGQQEEDLSDTFDESSDEDRLSPASSPKKRSEVMDESRALGIIRRFLKRSISRRRARARLRSVLQLIAASASRGSFCHKRSSLVKQENPTQRALAEMENEAEESSQEWNNKENKGPTKKKEGNGSHSPLAKSLIGLRPIPRSLLPKKINPEKMSASYSDVQPPDAGADDVPNSNQCFSFDSYIGNIVRHEEEESISFDEVDLPNDELCWFLSSNAPFSASESFEWAPFDGHDKNIIDCDEVRDNSNNVVTIFHGNDGVEVFGHEENRIDLLLGEKEGFQ